MKGQQKRDNEKNKRKKERTNAKRKRQAKRKGKEKRESGDKQSKAAADTTCSTALSVLAVSLLSRNILSMTGNQSEADEEL